MLKKIIVTAMAFMMFGCVGLKYNLEDTGAPPVPPPPPKGTVAELGAGTETASRVWSPADLATTFAGAAVEVQDEALTAANANGDTTHAPSQNAVIDYLMGTIDPDGDGSISDSSLSIADLTLTGAGGLVLGVAGTTLGTARWYTNVAENVYRFDLFSSDFTQNWGIRWQTGYPTENGGLFTVGTTGTGTWSYQGVDPGDVLLLPTDPAAHTLFGFDNTTNTYKPFTIGTGLSFDQASATLSSTGGSFTGGTLTSELVADETGIEFQPTDGISDCSAYAATGGGVFYDDSEGKLKKCQDNVLSDLDTNTGSATPLNDIADPTADGSVAQAGYKLTLTSTLNSAGAIWTFTNTTADLTADVSFIDLKLTDDADANGYFLRGYDNAGADLKWSIGADGAFTTTGTITAPSFASSAADGARYSTLPNNTTGNEPSLTAGESGFYSFETILYLYENGSKIGRVAALIDEDNMVSDSATRAPTQQSVKAYVDSGTKTLSNTTVDAASNVVKGFGYITLTSPSTLGSGVTHQTTATARVYGQALFANATDKATNYVEYILEVPRDLDTSVALKAYFKFNLGAADTADHDYLISMIDIADSADNATAVGDEVALDYTADATGASGDVETAGGNDLTGWAAALTPGSKWIIRVARDGDSATDASTGDSYSGPLTIRYGFTQ